MIYVFRTYESGRVDVFGCDNMDRVREVVGTADLIERGDFDDEDDGFLFTPGLDQAIVVIGDLINGIKEAEA